MKLSKILTSTCALALVGLTATAGITAFAANNPTAEDSKPELTPSIAQPLVKAEVSELTDEQKAEMESKKAEMEATQEKWDALTAEQKEEVYALKDKALEAESEIIDTYLELGIIDQETADEMEASITQHSENMRENGTMPMSGKKGGRGGKGGLKLVGEDDISGEVFATPTVEAGVAS